MATSVLRTHARRLRNRVRDRRARETDDLGRPERAALSPSRFSLRDGATGLLVPDPVFVFSSVRSGSTLLQMILDSHSRIYAPHELHLASFEVVPTRPNAAKAMRAMGLDETTMANLLWDRVLHARLVESGKSIIVDKTPNTTLQWQRVAAFWPRARTIVLLRHPLRVAQSLVSSRPDIADDKHYERVTRYAAALAAARDALPGALVIRYEDLTTDTERTVRRSCEWLGVDFEPAMLAYGEQRHDGQFRRGLGDWSETLRSGSIRPPAPDPDPAEVPVELHEACRLLGYPAP